jgi:drug/metabolite transporter (DMT)-like permease
VIGGKLFLHEQLGPRRLIAVALCLVGVFTIVGGVEVFDTPLSFADAAAFLAGMAYTGAGITNRFAVAIPMTSRTMMAFVGCTTIALLGLLVHVPAVPMMVASDWALLVLYAFIWLVGGTLLSTYGVTYVQASRAAVMQVLELIVAMVSAVLLGGESLSIGEIIGALMIFGATMIEALGTRSSEAPS